MKHSANIFLLFSLLFSLIYTKAYAYEAYNIPQVDRKAKDSYEFDFIYTEKHRAFAIASGGTWSWRSGKETVELAKQEALDACSKLTQQKCFLYAVDEQIVLDQQAWEQSWGPYKTPQQAAQAKTGIKLGNRFYDVSFIDPEGNKKSVSDLKGKVVFVHFWGAWCPSCRLEFNTLINTYQILKGMMGDNIEFLILQVREPIETSRKWTEKFRLTALPLSDSGIKSEEDSHLTLKDGSKIKDRTLAKVFPSSYVLDKNGLVVFAHKGSIKDWTEYIAFFKDVAERSKN